MRCLDEPDLKIRVAAVGRLLHVAAERGHRVFLLGAAPGVADAAADVLRGRCPGLNVVGMAGPLLRDLTAEQMAELITQVRAVRPDVLVLAFAMPLGELWMAENYQTFGAPVTIQAVSSRPPQAAASARNAGSRSDAPSRSRTTRTLIRKLR